MLTVISDSFPPRVSGSAILLANLLSSYPGDVRAVAGRGSPWSKPDPAFRPPCPTTYLGLPRISPRVGYHLLERWPALLSRSIQGSIQRMLRKSGAHVVLAAYPREDFLVAAFLAARELHLPFYTYLHDLWIENMSPGTARGRFAKRWEPLILTKSTRVLCTTEATQEHYEGKYGIRTDLLPHTIPESDCLRASGGMSLARPSDPRVLFVGAVNSAMNLDALKVLAAASELLPPGFELLLCTSADLAGLRRVGIRSSRLRAIYVSRAEVQRLQSETHVLIAPLSHKNCSVDEVRTVFSTKLLEYLVSGRPIVVFAPKGSYEAESARQRGWGYVVTEDAPAALAAAIMQVISDEKLAAGLVRAALQEARSRSARLHAERLHEWVLADTS